MSGRIKNPHPAQIAAQAATERVKARRPENAEVPEPAPAAPRPTKKTAAKKTAAKPK